MQLRDKVLKYEDPYTKRNKKKWLNNSLFRLASTVKFTNKRKRDTSTRNWRLK